MERKMRPRRRARGVNQQEDSYEEEKVEIEHEKDSDDDSSIKPGAVAVPGPRSARCWLPTLVPLTASDAAHHYNRSLFAQ
jgi:hypothetical protein